MPAESRATGIMPGTGKICRSPDIMHMKARCKCDQSQSKADVLRSNLYNKTYKVADFRYC